MIRAVALGSPDLRNLFRLVEPSERNTVCTVFRGGDRTGRGSVAGAVRSEGGL